MDTTVDNIYCLPSYCTTLVYFLFLFFLKDEDPALRELAELESEGCLQDIQDLRQKVEL